MSHGLYWEQLEPLPLRACEVRSRRSTRPTMPVSRPDPWADSKSRSISGSYNLRRRNIRVQNWCFDSFIAYGYHTIPYRTVPYRTVPYRTVPYHTIPYHTIPYHTITYHTKHIVLQYFRVQNWGGSTFWILPGVWAFAGLSGCRPRCSQASARSSLAPSRGPGLHRAQYPSRNRP